MSGFFGNYNLRVLISFFSWNDRNGAKAQLSPSSDVPPLKQWAIGFFISVGFSQRTEYLFSIRL